MKMGIFSFFTRLVADLPDRETIGIKFRKVFKQCVKVSFFVTLIISLVGLISQVAHEAKKWNTIPVAIGFFLAFLLVKWIESKTLVDQPELDNASELDKLWKEATGAVGKSIKLFVFTPILYFGVVLLECLAKNVTDFLLIWMTSFPASFYLCVTVETFVSYGWLCESWAENTVLKYFFN